MSRRSLRILGEESLSALAHAMREGEKDTKRRLRKAIRDVAKPLGQETIAAGAAAMPHRGGLSARVAAAKPGISNLLGSANPRVAIRLTNKQRDSLKAMDQGLLRHPVFARDGRKRAWVSQHVPADAFSDAFQAGAPRVRAAALEAATEVLNQIAREA